MIIRRALLLAVLAGILLSLAACVSGTPQPTPGPTATLTPSVMLPSGALAAGAAATRAPLLTPVGGTQPAPVRASTLLPTLVPGGAGAVLPAVPILMYHQIRVLPANASKDDFEWTVTPAALDAQLGYLVQKGYVTISLDQLLDGYAGKSALPAKPVVITFDDGWRTQYTNALPLLKKYNQTATFYIVTSYHVGKGGYFDWSMSADVQKAGMSIASHTLDHTALNGLPAAELDRQLRESKSTLEAKLGVSVSHLAYPYGAYNDTVIAAVKRAGYRSAVTINPTVVKNPLSPYLLPRLHSTYNDTLTDFAKKLP